MPVDHRAQSPSIWWRLAPAVLAFLSAAFVLPVIFLGNDLTSEGYDQRIAHLPAIEQFAAQLPAPDLSSYPSATGPGYHLLLAVPARLGFGVQWLRVISSLAGVGLVLLAWRGGARAAGPGVAFALALPLAFSSYVLSGSAWLTTDVLSVLVGSAVVLVAACVVPDRRAFLALAVLLAAALSIRQTNVFLAVPILAAGILGSPLGRSASDAEQWHGDEPRRWSRLAWACLALLPGMLLLLALVRAWGGLVPPAFREMHDRGLNPIAPAYGMALVGVWGGIALLPMGAEVLRAVRRHRLAVALLALFAVVAAAMPESSWSRDEGRWGGALWQAVKSFPVIEGRSTLLVAAAGLGAILLSALWIRAAEVRRGRQATIVIMTLLALFVVQAGNSQVWERYFDPAILVALAWLTALGIDRTRPHSAGRAVLGAGLLALAQLAISALNFWAPAFGLFAVP